jgi:hypothetical protein
MLVVGNKLILEGKRQLGEFLQGPNLRTLSPELLLVKTTLRQNRSEKSIQSLDLVFGQSLTVEAAQALASRLRGLGIRSE